MRSTLADFADVESDDITMAIDGCGAPAFFLSLHRAALAYARLMAGAIERYAESGAAVVDAMTTFPHYVAGNWSMTTPLMAAFGGELLAKEGAEGFYAMALAPSLCGELTDRLRLADDVAVGIALKIDDGSMERGRNPVILRLLEVNFELEGFTVLLAHDGAEGIEVARTSQPDVIISDIMMPRTSGLELVETLKVDPDTKAIPIILLSAKAQTSDLKIGLEAGADDYVTKPFEPLDLVERVNELLSR